MAEKVTKEEIDNFLEKHRKFFIKFNWVTDNIYEVWFSSEMIRKNPKDGQPYISYCWGMGDYEPYYLDDYGKTWAWKLEHLEDFENYRLSDDGKYWIHKEEQG